ncbi:hypothetical protein E3A20_20820 [Planctomyces bekefii]|uniref:Uncharacterized protein n=1 Tax=Planctomyces bekefii TaxID=1653850 RepID=A0A5C6M3V5_9PLAN|nr:hypothetical protein E3A20_20820 [Planctomyces bekefii]
MWPKNRSSLSITAILLCLAVATQAWAEGAAKTVATGNTPGLKIEPITDPKVNSPREDLRLKLFKDSPKTFGCKAIPAPKNRTGVDSSLDQFLAEVTDAIKNRSELKLQPHFHPRLNIGIPALSETFAKLANTYGPKQDVTVFRLWALNVPDPDLNASSTLSGDKTPSEIPCTADDLSVHAMYGYPLQFGVWLQILGEKEVGRIYLSIVPTQGRWNLGAFHAQQWTHAEKDPEQWLLNAQRIESLKLPEAAFVAYDIASKLLDGGNLVIMNQRAEVLKRRDAIMTPEQFQDKIRKTLSEYKVLASNSLFVVGGGGVLVRIEVPSEISVEQLKNTCAAISSKLKRESWSQELNGVRCNVNLPKENPKVDGAIGGVYLAFRDLKN